MSTVTIKGNVAHSDTENGLMYEVIKGVVLNTRSTDPTSQRFQIFCVPICYIILSNSS